MALNSHDQLLDCCSKCESYPENYLRPGILKRHLQSLRRCLDTKSEDLFDPENECLDFLELNDGSNKYMSKRICHGRELESHLQANHKDPKCRHIFAQADDSRAPLNCSRASFTQVLTFQQVSPTFLEYIQSFGDTEKPLDYSLIGFQSEDSLCVSGNEVLEIPKLGRSGRELRVSYLIRSVERSETNFGGKHWPWKIRQMAVYHSFDMVNGRAFWLNIKANGLMKDTITDAASEIPELRSNSLTDAAGCFAATLTTHLLILEWCDSNWRSCINDTEDVLGRIITKAKTTPLDEGGKNDPLSRAVTMKRIESNKIGPKKATSKNGLAGGIRTGFDKVITNLQGKWPRGDTATSTTSHPGNAAGSQTKQNTENQGKRDISHLSEVFSFGELQELHYFGEQVQEMRLVIQLDIQALRDIKETYQSLIERDDLEEELRRKCKKQVATFSRKVDRLIKSLEVRLTQLDTMVSWINDGKSLFDNILQFKSVQASHIFAEIAYGQGRKMEKIANKTEQETGSMHIITFVTLAFLPGTFVAVRYGWPYLRRSISDLTVDQTFFQSGLVSLPDSGDKDGGAQTGVQLNKEGFILFCKVCIPMMVTTFVLWFLAYRWLKNRRSRKRLQEEGEA